MSAALLMAETWQPTVLRLVPFSNNNARSHENLRLSRASHVDLGTPRGFPVLAVTRDPASACSDTRSTISGKSEDESKANSRLFGNSRADESKDNMLNTKSQRSVDSVSPNEILCSGDYQGLQYSVHNINDHISSTSSLNSSDSSSVARARKETRNSVDNTKNKFLPKPTFAISGDSKHIILPNGFRRSVPLTPGELDLQRYKDNYTIEQSQKRRKYKLNVNQLPRSTTPINDHDPDKLNMKQVIAFLQTKTSSRDNNNTIQKKVLFEKRQSPQTLRRSFELALTQSNKHSNSNPPTPSSTRSLSLSEQVSIHTIGSRETGTVSVLSTRSTPVIINRQDKTGKPSSSLDSKSCGGRTYARRGRYYRPMKEFKLHRFLAIAPEGKGVACVTGQSKSSNHEANAEENPASLPQPKIKYRTRSIRKKAEDDAENENNVPGKSRKTTTANLIHRRAVQRQVDAANESEAADAEAKSTAIHLPSVNLSDEHHDVTQAVDENRSSVEAEEDVDSEDDDIASTTTAATYNSLTLVQKDAEPKFNFKVSIAQPNEKIILKETGHDRYIIHKMEGSESNTSAMADGNFTSISGSELCEGLQRKTQKVSEEKLAKIAAEPENRFSVIPQKKLHVSLPKENKKGYTNEIVRLTLRQEKDATRVTTYMSDMKKGPVVRDPMSLEGSAKSDSSWPYTSSQVVNKIEKGHNSYLGDKKSSGRNGVTAVRKKLKTHMYNNE